MSKAKTREREEARRLRRDEGASIKEIARRTGAAQSSISRWVRDIELTDEQREFLRIAAYNGHVKGRTTNSRLRREARAMAQEEGRMLARQGDALFVCGCMLYWAEGARERNQLRFTNSDPEMVRLFLSFLRSYWNLGDEAIRITCNLFADHQERQREIEDFWLDVAWPPAQLPVQVDRERLLEVQQEEAPEQAAVRRLPSRRLAYASNSDDLRGDPRDRRFYQGVLAGIDRSCPRARTNVATVS